MIAELTFTPRFLRSSRPCVAAVMVALLGLQADALAKESKAHLLGPTGMIGLDSKQDIKVTQVEKDSPAEGAIKAGDVIIGVGGKKFQGQPRHEFAAAINEAEVTGVLELMLKGGKGADLKLKKYGPFSDTAPYDCPKTRALVTACADQLIANEKQLKEDRLAIGWLGLMATGEDKYLDVVKARLPEQEWAKPDRELLMAIVNGEQDGGYVGWYWGYQLIALSEYHLLTGDQSVLPGIESYALALSKGQDAAGIWGHRMTSPTRNGRLPGYSHINQPSLSCFIGLILAKACGVQSPELDKAIGKCQGFYNTFTGKGTIPYGVHDPNSREFNNNGMSGSTAVAMSLVGDKKAARFFSRQVATAYDNLETGHASHFFNVLWSPLGTHVAGPEVTREYHKHSRWLYTLYRSWDGRFTYDGSSHKSLSPSGALLLNYCTPRKQLFITGKKADESLWASGAEVEEIIKLSKTDYDKLSVDELLAMFGHEAPQARRAAAWLLRDREGDFLDKVDALIREGNDLEQISAIGFYGYQCPPEWAKPRLELIGKVLRDADEHPEVRATAALVVSGLGPEAHAYHADMLRLLIADKPGDEYGLIDAEIGKALTAASSNPYADGLTKDKDLFYDGVRKLARNPRQGGRGLAMKMLEHMPMEDFPLVAEEIRMVALNRSTSSHSYHNPGSTLLPGAQVLARLGIREGLDWAMQTLDTEDGKGSFKIRAVQGVLLAYGAHSKEVVEEIKKNPKRLASMSGGRFSGLWKQILTKIEKGEAPTPELIPFEKAKK